MRSIEGRLWGALGDISVLEKSTETLVAAAGSGKANDNAYRLRAEGKRQTLALADTSGHNFEFILVIGVGASCDRATDRKTGWSL